QSRSRVGVRIMRTRLFTHPTLLLACFTLLVAGCTRQIDGRGLADAESFEIKNILLCTVARSSTAADVGTAIAIHGLLDGESSIQFTSGNRSPMQKIYDTQ